MENRRPLERESAVWPLPSTPTNTAFDDFDIDAIAAGVDYKFNDNFKLYGYYASLETQGDRDISTKATTDTTAALGLDLKF